MLSELEKLKKKNKEYKKEINRLEKEIENLKESLQISCEFSPYDCNCSSCVMRWSY